MTVLASDDFAGLGTASLSGRTLNNALSGSGTRAWSGASFVGDGAGALSSASNTATALVSVTGANKCRVRVAPTGSENMILWGRRGSSAPETGIGLLLVSQTSLRVSSFNAGTRTDHQTLGITAPGTAFWMEVEVSGLVVTCRILNNDTSVRNTLSHTFSGSVPSGGDFWGFGFFQDGNSSKFDDFVSDDGVAGDVTAPTLTSATATATSATTATGGITTDEAGPAWAVLTTSSTTPTAAQIKAGQSHTGASASASDTATLSVGANPGVFDFTGLTGGGTYWLHVVQDDTATPANTATPITSASSITTPTPDTTPPTMNGSITVGTKTSGSISISYPAASDNVAVTGYEVSTNGSTWSDNGTSLSYTFLGLSALTSYTLYVRAYDAAGNRAATPLTVTTSTYRAGDTAANILANTGPVGGNPAGFLYAFASTVSSTDWISYTIVSGPTPSGGTLDASPDGTFTYVGPDAATMVIQPEVNGSNAAETITVTLYDAADTTPPFLSSASSAATGANTATGQVSTNEANGTLYALISTDNGLIDVDDDGFWLASGKQSQAVTATGVQNVSFSGLLPSTTYTVYFGQEDSALNRSGVVRTFEITTSAAPDTELPVLTGSITVTSITSTGYYLSWPTGTDNTGVAGYEYSLNGGASWADNGNVTTKSITGRAPESTDQVRVRAYDAAGNKSTPPLSTSVTLLAGPDVTSPLLTDPTAYASGPTTASGTVTTNEATGTLFFLRNTSATATAAAVKAGLSQAVTAAGIQTVNVTGLTASTPGNYIHYLHQDGSGNDSLVSSSAAFATPAAPAPGLKVIGAQPTKLIARPITRPIAIRQTD